jgi:hypothetical protein
MLPEHAIDLPVMANTSAADRAGYAPEHRRAIPALRLEQETKMTTTLKTLSALALAMVALSATTFVAASVTPANATPKITWGGEPPRYHDSDRDYDRDRDHDHDYGRDRWHFHGSYWNWRLPVYDTTACVYEYKFRTVFLPGFGLKREFVKVCEGI